MRFDDSLKTVLSADMAPGFGAQSAWRQLVDLMGRGRIPADEPSIARLRLLRQAVPTAVRAASARALAFASPAPGLVGFFAEDELAIAAPVLRTVTLTGPEWVGLLPRLTPAGRSVLRHRRDLPAEAERGLESFGATDFVLDYEASAATVPAPAAAGVADAPAVEPALPVIDAPLSETPFMALGDIARGLPFIAEALRRVEPNPLPSNSPPAVVEPVPANDVPRFEISDLVARIDAFNQQRAVASDPEPVPQTQREAGTFHFETDADGVIRWIEGVSRTALIGVTLAHAAPQGLAQVDGVATGAWRRRSSFGDARLEVGGASDARGSWRLSAVPTFDHASGRFTGFRGTARRPRRDESAAPSTVQVPASDSLRQLVHELRTPTNAIAGFAELIETQLLGPVSDLYRTRAAAIRSQAADLLAAIDDLDTAARIEGQALDLRPAIVPVLPLLSRVVEDLEPLARLRGTRAELDPASAARDIAGDDRAVERLVGRLMAALVSAGSAGETIAIVVAPSPDDQVVVLFDRPRALAAHGDDPLFSIDAEQDAELEGAPLLGTGFALRLAQNLAGELGGALAIDGDRLTLRLPAAVDRDMGQASAN